MMQLYYSRVSWISGIILFVAFALTFWPTRGRILTCATLWSAGAFALAGIRAYDFFLRGAIGHSFDPAGRSTIPLVVWLVPVVLLLLVTVESVLLFPWITQQRALNLGRTVFLFIVPILILIRMVSEGGDHWGFPLGSEWLGLPLLWFRIRERLP